jgi:hypothetical protein
MVDGQIPSLGSLGVLFCKWIVLDIATLWLFNTKKTRPNLQDTLWQFDIAMEHHQF